MKDHKELADHFIFRFFTAGSVTVLEVYATQKYTFWGDMLALSEARGLEKEGRVIFFHF